jgi:ribosomal protein S18 acetylase RimI-like enzyme
MADVTSLSDINSRAYGAPLGTLRSFFRMTFLIEYSYAYIVSLAGQDIACASVTPSLDWLYVHSVATLPAFRRKGYGTLVTKHAIEDVHLG